MPDNQWQPVTAAQKMALDCEADLLFFGGAAGSLKSHTILLDGIQERDNPNLRAIWFRESYPQLLDLIDKAHRIFRPLGATYNEQKKLWSFPSGAHGRFAYLSRDADAYEYFGHEFSFIGVDESTRHTEARLRLIISRLRSTDPTLKLRVRWGSNPGGIGAAFHKKIFLKDACPVHEPSRCVVPGQIYRDAVWPSDGKPIPMSVAFVPGHLSDHRLLGDDYRKLLDMQGGVLSSQLEAGCWCSLAGQFFANWQKAKMVIPYATIQELYWWTFFLSIDYGFGQSKAAAGLYVKTPALEGYPQGRIFKIGEICVPNMPAYEFGELVAKRFIEPVVSREFDTEHRRNIEVIFLDPANFKDIGDGHTIADQLDECFKPYGLSVTPASNDRIGGWQLMYRMLDTGDFAVADNCPQTAEAIPTRMHDEKRPGDLVKVSGDAGDDLADETRYALYSFINDPRKPSQVRMAEVLQGFKERPMETIAEAMKLERQLRQESQPLLVSGNARRLQRMRQRRQF